jgi:hypothetical protein
MEGRTIGQELIKLGMSGLAECPPPKVLSGNKMTLMMR